MKNKLSFGSIIFVLCFYSMGFAQTKDTIDVAPGFNTLPNKIEQDVQNGLDMDNRVYRLVNDQPYLIDHTMQTNFVLNIMSPSDGKPALIQPVQDINGASPNILFQLYKDLNIDNIAVALINNAGAIRNSVFVLQTDSLTVTANNCVFELTGLNVFSSNGLWANLKFTNCIFNNCLRYNNIFNGRGFDDRANVVESFSAENCSFINMRSAIHFWGPFVRNYYINHCTFYNATTFLRGFNTGVDVTFTNNILVNSGIYPINYDPQNNTDSTEGYQPAGVIDVDSLVINLASESDKHWVVKNNNYWFTDNVTSYYSTLNDTLILRPWINQNDREFAARYPDRYNIEDALSVNPGFINPPPDDSLIIWVDAYLNGARNEDELPNTIFAPNGLLDNNGVAILSYSFVDLSYDISSPLYTAGTDGKPLGDLQWFKNITDVNVIENVIPKDYTLNQNYPNPFNPATQISYSIPKESKVKLEIFDILGQQILTLVDQMQAAGKYNIFFNGSELSSGTYIYRLTTPSQLISKKMILIK